MERINKSLQSGTGSLKQRAGRKSQKRMWMEQRAWLRHGAFCICPSPLQFLDFAMPQSTGALETAFFLSLSHLP